MKDEDKQKLLEELGKAMKSLEHWNQFQHLFSGDDAEKKLAELRQNIVTILFYTELSELKKVTHPAEKPLRANAKGLVKVRPVDGTKTYPTFF